MTLAKILFILPLTFLSSAHAWETIKAPVKIESAAFSKMLFQAYQDEGMQPDGRVVMPRLFACENSAGTYSCELFANEWNVAKAPSGVANKLFTPVTEDAVFDAMEYMRILPTITEDSDTSTSAKNLELTENGKHYSLNCVVATNKDPVEIVMAQCALYNGIQD